MTVWWAEFEGSGLAKKDFRSQREGLQDTQLQHLEALEQSGPRLATCADDCTVRVWRRKPREGAQAQNSGMPSIIRSAAIDEDWYQEAILPKAHDRAVYSVSWSRTTGLLVSAGSDGKIVVYRERWRSQDSNGTAMEGVESADGTAPATEAPEASPTEWVVVAEIFSAHDVFEINHVTWAKRADKGQRWDTEEIIVSTGDEGEVRVWTLDEAVVKA